MSERKSSRRSSIDARSASYNKFLKPKNLKIISPTMKSDTRIPRLLLRSRKEKKEKDKENNNRKKRTIGEIFSKPKVKLVVGSINTIKRRRETNNKMKEYKNMECFFSRRMCIRVPEITLSDNICT